MKNCKKAVFFLVISFLILGLVITSCTSSTPAPATTSSPAKTTQVTSSPPLTTTSQMTSPPTSISLPTTSQVIPATTKPPTSTQTTSANAFPTGGILNIIKSTVPNTLGPVASMGAPGATFLMPALETLIGIDKEGPTPTKLATSWDIAPDGKSLTLHLRKGVKFHDGTDFDAAAVKYNFDQKIGSRPEIISVTSAEVVDSYTVKLNLSSYSNTLLFQLGWIAGMMESPAALKTHDKDWFATNMVGAGPFAFVGYNRDVSLVFNRFKDYWDSGKPYVDGIKYTFIVDPMTAEAYFRSGAGSLWDQILPASLKNITSLGNPVNAVPRTVWMAIGDSANTSSPFAKKEVRQALDYAIDKKAVVDTFGFGTWEAPVGPFSAKQYGSIPNFQGRTYDLKKAKQLLADAGYPNGFLTSLYARDNVDRNVLVAFQSYLKAIGINAEIRPVTTTAFQNLRERGWNGILMVNMGIVGSYAKMLQTDGPTKASAVSATISDDYLAALNRALAAKDKDTELKMNQQLAQFVFDEAIMIPWLIDSVIAVYDKSVHVDINTINLQNWNPGNTWISK
jgi:peptide/nickel transport system substrate-binding protein